MKELGKRVALSPPAVTERVKRLEESGVILGYKSIINPKKLDRSIDVLINVSMKVDKHKKFLEFAINNKYIIDCYHVTGPYCMIVKACLDKMSELEKLIGKIQEYGNTETQMILSTPIEDKIFEYLDNNG